MTPSIGSVQGKIWGHTQLVYCFNSMEAHSIDVMAGGFCSRHLHYTKWNRFYVISGELIIRIFDGDGVVDETTIGPGQISDVPPGIRHEFEATTETHAMEFYWTELDSEDIDRCGTQGGLRTNE
jgi:cupin superfamily acireductone dioxygenase involved in methionine salvage